MSVSRGEARGKQLQLVSQHRAASRPGHIEVRMIGQIQDGGLVGRGLIFDFQIRAGNGVAYRHGEISRIPFLTILAQIVKGNAVGDRLRLPHHIVEPARTPVE